MKDFIFELRVYPEDTDSFGIVHHANLIKYMERARTQWLLTLGFRINDLLREGILFVIKKIDIEYLHPTKMLDELVIYTRIIELRKVSKTYEQIIYSKQDKNKIFCKAHIQVVCVNDKLRPQAIPQKIIASSLERK